MKIIIIGSEHEGHWYHKMIGKVFDAQLRHTGNSYTLLDTEFNYKQLPEKLHNRLSKRPGAKLGVFTRNAEPFLVKTNREASNLLKEEYE